MVREEPEGSEEEVLSAMEIAELLRGEGLGPSEEIEIGEYRLTRSELDPDRYLIKRSDGELLDDLRISAFRSMRRLAAYLKKRPESPDDDGLSESEAPPEPDHSGRGYE